MMRTYTVLPVFLIGLFLMVAGAAHAQDQTPPPVATSEGPVINVNEAAQDAVEVTETAARSTLETVTDLLSRLTIRPTSSIVRFLLIIGGLALLFLGWRVYEFIIIIAGFLIGAAFAVAVVGDQSTLVTIAALLLGGLIGAALSVFVYYLAVFLIGGYVGIVLTEGLANTLSLAPVAPIVLLLAALIGGVILIALSFELLVLLAIIVGAQMLSLGLGLGTEWTVIFAIIGLIAQLVVTRWSGFNVRRRPTWRNPLRRLTARL